MSVRSVNHIAGNMQNIDEIIEIDLERIFHVLAFEYRFIEVECDPAIVLVIDQPFLNGREIYSTVILTSKIAEPTMTACFEPGLRHCKNLISP